MRPRVGCRRATAVRPTTRAWLAGIGLWLISSQKNTLVFQTQGERISLRVLNPYGEQVDEVHDLMNAR